MSFHRSIQIADTTVKCLKCGREFTANTLRQAWEQADKHCAAVDDWQADATEVQQDLPLLGRFHAYVAAAGKRGHYAGVLINSDHHLSVATARELAAALLAHADIAEAFAEGR